MAPKAQDSLRFHQQEVDVLGVVGAVTVRAADAARQVFGLGKVLRFQAGLMAFRTDRCRLRRTQLPKANDLGEVGAAVLHVGLPGAMTCLASMLVAFKQRRMRSIGKVLVPHFLVALLAGVCLGVLAARRAGKHGGCLRLRTTRLPFFGAGRKNAAGNQESQDQREGFAGEIHFHSKSLTGRSWNQTGKFHRFSIAFKAA